MFQRSGSFPRLSPQLHYFPAFGFVSFWAFISTLALAPDAPRARRKLRRCISVLPYLYANNLVPSSFPAIVSSTQVAPSLASPSCSSSPSPSHPSAMDCSRSLRCSGPSNRLQAVQLLAYALVGLISSVPSSPGGELLLHRVVLP